MRPCSQGSNWKDRINSSCDDDPESRLLDQHVKPAKENAASELVVNVHLERAMVSPRAQSLRFLRRIARLASRKLPKYLIFVVLFLCNRG